MYAMDYFATYESRTGLRPRNFSPMPAFLQTSTGGNDETRYRLYGTFKRFLDWGKPINDCMRDRVLYRWSGLVNDHRRWALLRSIVRCADLERVASILQWMLAADSQKADGKPGSPIRWFDYMVSPDGEIWVRPRPGMVYEAVPANQRRTRATP